MIDISSTINLPYFATVFNVERKTGAMVDGIWTPDAPTDFNNVSGLTMEILFLTKTGVLY